MKYKINEKTLNVSIYDIFTAKRINKHISIAMGMIKKYNLENELKPEFEYSSSPLLFVGLKYNLPEEAREFDYTSMRFCRGYYSFGGYNFRFNKMDFYDRVIKPYTKKEYSEA